MFSVDDSPQTFDPHVRGNSSLAFPGLAICQQEFNGIITIDSMDLLVKEEWESTYFVLVESAAIYRSQEEKQAVVEAQAIQNAASLDYLLEDSSGNNSDENSDCDSQDSCFGLESEDLDEVLRDEFYEPS